MNSKERVKAALYFKNPDKVPFWHMVGGDIIPLPLTYSENWKPGMNEGEERLFPHIRGYFKWDRPDWAKINPEYEGMDWRKIPHEEIDEWGCIWNMKGNDKDMGHPGRPSLLDWKDFDDYIEKYKPDPNDESRYRLALELKEAADENLYFALINDSHGPSQLSAAIRGFNNYLIDHKKHPEELKQLLEVVTEYHIQCLKKGIKMGLNPNGYMFADDLGEQTGPFFSPRTFKEFYAPVYKRIIEEAHDLGIEVHLHCCGKIDRLLSAFIECGLDAIELDSPRMSGYHDLKPYRGKIMFWACINIQSIYPKGTPEEVEREVWHMVRNLGTKNGGFGAYFYDTPKDIQVPRKNIKAFKRGLEKYGDYSQIPEHWWEYPVTEVWKDDVVPQLPPLEKNY